MLVEKGETRNIFLIPGGKDSEYRNTRTFEDLVDIFVFFGGEILQKADNKLLALFKIFSL